MIDSYLSIVEPTIEILFKDRGSKFYATAFPIDTEMEVDILIAELRKKHPKAGHHCYAWKLGPSDQNYRANDDGEPNHSAGDPILGQIQARELSDILVVVSRIFGGTKLGVGGLIQAYREAASLALEQAKIVKRTITASVNIYFEYPQMSQVMRFIDEHKYTMEFQELTDTCLIRIAVPQSQQQRVIDQINQMYPIKASTLEESTSH
ncbi:IMPACT family protein [Nonlabens xiamenensis]|uniref:IMPACT family protein n=1 Tax=Nonlabens xiamenensis TaxID=2341043 RepID=UPI000F60FE2D|nr:YigZ family protein [Nonlabens xiamenensis]